MERLNQRLKQAHDALTSLEEVLLMDLNKVVRDAAIKRFEYTVEITWKLAQTYLREQESLDYASPRRVIRACYEIKFLDEKQTEAFLDMLNDRNLSSQTYDEEIAAAIYSRLKSHGQLLAFLVNTISEAAVSNK